MSVPTDCEFELLIHLGRIRNVDLQHRGVYVIQLRLSHESQSYPPSGNFSAPSTLDSYVGDRWLNAPRLMSICHIDDNEKYFRSRSFVVRFRDEIHSLNEGGIWRVPIETITSLGNELPYCSQQLCLTVELLCAELQTLPESGYRDPLHDIEEMLPPCTVCGSGSLGDAEPDYKVVSTQSLMLRVGTGVQQYFSVRFDRFNFSDLQMMVLGSYNKIQYDMSELKTRFDAWESAVIADTFSPSSSVESSSSLPPALPSVPGINQSPAVCIPKSSSDETSSAVNLVRQLLVPATRNHVRLLEALQPLLLKYAELGGEDSRQSVRDGAGEELFRDVTLWHNDDMMMQILIAEDREGDTPLS